MYMKNMIAIAFLKTVAPLLAVAGTDAAIEPDPRVPLADPFILCENGVYYA